tara:strand:- start:19787 stop:20992 length:1206 start_codon:yes stop_codon:yes gene_type:complete
MKILPQTVALLLGAAQLCAQLPDTEGGIDLSDDPAPSIGEALGNVGVALDRWVERFDLHGFVATRFMDTEARGGHPDGFLGIYQGLLFVEADVRDVGSIFIEVELDYFRDQDPNGTGVNEIYARFDRPSGEGSLGLKIGRFNLPFGEYYLQEDAPINHLIALPIAMPYRWDEGIMLFGDNGTSGFAFSVTEGSYDRFSTNGVSPAITARVHTNPCEGLYLSASGHYVRDTQATAICFSGGVLTPVGGGVSGASPSTSIGAALGSLDAKWTVCRGFDVQASVGIAQIDDDVDTFDREFGWWMLEPSYAFSTSWRTTLRWSGVGTFDNNEGYQFDGRPYGNGIATYGFDQMRAQRVAVGVTHTFAPGVIAKVEGGFDYFEATALSGLRNDTRNFVAAEFVLSF